MQIIGWIFFGLLIAVFACGIIAPLLPKIPPADEQADNDRLLNELYNEFREQASADPLASSMLYTPTPKPRTPNPAA